MVLLRAVDAASRGDLGYPIEYSDEHDDLQKVSIALDEMFKQIRVKPPEQAMPAKGSHQTIVETSQANDEIDDVMEGVVTQSESTGDSAGNVEAAASRLGDIATSLDTLLQKFQQHRKAA